MGLLDALIGTAPEAKVESKTKLSPEQQKLLNEVLLPLLSGDVESGTFAAGDRQFTSPLTAGESTSLAALEAKALAGAQPTEGGDFLSSLFTQGADAFQVGPESPLTQFFGVGAEDFEDFFTKVIQEPLVESFEQDVLPSITRRAAGTGNLFGSAAQENIERAQDTLIEELARQRANIGFQAREAGLERGLKAAGLTEQLQATGFESAQGREFQAALATEGLDVDRSKLELETIIQNIQAQGLPREAANQEIAAQYGEFLRQEGLQDTRINQILAAVGLPTLENIGLVTQGSQGLLGGVASGFATGFGSTF